MGLVVIDDDPIGTLEEMRSVILSFNEDVGFDPEPMIEDVQGVVRVSERTRAHLRRRKENGHESGFERAPRSHTHDSQRVESVGFQVPDLLVDKPDRFSSPQSNVLRPPRQDYVE